MHKKLVFVAGALKNLRAFPAAAKRSAGLELWRVQNGLQPSDYKPMPGIGPGVEEIRVWSTDSTFRLIYTARLGDAVYVLHAFRKTTQVTAKADLELAKARLKELLESRR